MKRFYSLLTVLFFGLTFNLSAQETVIAVWDFADNSVDGDINPDFSSATNTDLGYLNGGQTGDNAWTNTDVVGGDFDNSYTLSNSSPLASAASGYILNNLNLGPTTATAVAGSGLVNNKIHFSLSFKSISLASASDKLLFYLKDANSGTGTNWRQTGFIIKQNATGEKIEVKSLIYNAGNSAATQKLCGNFGTGLTLADFTIGVTLDYDSAGDGTNVASIRFWIGSPDTYSSGDGNAWGFKMFNNDGFANTNSFPALTATPTGNAGIGLANSVTRFLQFTPNLTTEGSEVVFDQIKISTGEYENTVAAGNTSTPDNSITELYFSKYGEGSSNNKFLEIYNGTDSDIDLSNYAFPNVTNAPTTAGEYEYWNTFTAGAIVAAGDVYVIAHGSADATILAQADMTHNFLSNGDDGYALVSGTETSYVVIDWLGDFEADPGSGWEVAGVSNGTKDHTLTRKSTVCGPNNNWTLSAGTTAEDSEWIVGDKDSGWDTIGSYTGCVFDTTAPVITLVGANPQELTVGDAYAELGATATDDTDDDTALTATIVIDASAVDTATAGSYSVTYDVSDAAGNAATQVTRTVTVEAPLLITTSVCATATSVRLTGPWWGWDPAGGPVASDNGDGTWTFTLDPAPTADMEYLLVVDGVQENLIANMANGGDCAPITDYANYANRLWETTAQSINMTDSGLFSTGNNATWNTIFTAVLNSEGVATSGLAQTVVINITDLPDGSTYRIYKTTSTGAADFTQLGDLVMGENTITVPAVEFNRTVKFQFSGSGSIEFDSFSLNSGVLYLGDPTVVNVTNNYGQCGASCVVPVITMTGSDATITVGDVYTDAGATASDDEEGDITANITVVSTVDTTTAGTYAVTYNVNDGALNAATEVVRTVTVEAALPPNDSDSEQFCASGTDAAPTTITLTPDDLTVNGGANLLSVSVTSGTIGTATWVGNWYDANLTVTGGVSDGVTATGLAAMAGLDITGFTSVTMTSVDLDNWSDTVEMCLNLSVTYLEPSCVTPTDLTVSGITTTGAVVSWVSDGTQFMIELQPAGSAQGTAGGYVIGDIEAYTATSVDLTGFLTPNTSYSVYVINVCGDVMSSWSDPVSFTTLPAPIVPDYMNDFATYPGDLWTEAQGSPITGLTAGATTSLWAADGFANDGFSGAARLNIYSTGRDEWLISPVFDLSAMNYFLNLDAAATEYGSSTLDAIWGSDDFAGLYVTTDDGATWTELYLWDGTNNPGAQGTMMPEIELSGYSTVQFGIYGESTALNEDIDFFVDNFSITAESQAPSCVAPINLTVSGITTTGAVVSWVSDGTQFMIELQPAGSAQGTAGGYVIGDIEAYTATSVDLTGFLTPNTSYSVYVVNVCDSSNSEYTGPLTFTTPNQASCGETVVYTQVASGDYNVILTGGNPASVTISGDLEQSSFSDTCYDNIYVYDGAGTLLNAGNTCGVFTDVTYESTDGTISVNITNDSSVQNGDVSLAFSCVPPDTSAPVITLNGADSVDLFFGDTYTDAGASASDDVDGDLTSSIVVAGVVDVLTVGTYTVTYNVSDAAGNAATEVTRTVNVTIDSVRSILTFEEYPVTGNTWYGDAGQVTSIVADPDTSGGDHGNVGKMELAAAGEPWQNSQLNLVADTYAVNLLDGTAKRIIFDMWSETATCGLIKFEQGLNGAGNKELAFNVSGNGWETIVVDFTSGGHDGSAVNGEYNKIVLFFNYCDAAGNPIGTAPDVRYVDNISYLQGTLNEPPFNPGPAPIPTQLEEDVVSVYSDTYSNNIATNLNPGWGQETAQSEFQLAEGDTALLYSNLNYQGLLYTSTDVTTMDYVHLDYYTDDSTALGFYVIQEGTGENGYSIDTELGITTGQWVSVDIPLSAYTVTDLSGVNQIKTDGNGTVYLDNIYFYTEPTAGIEDAELSQFTYFPNPVNNVLTIKAQASIDSITIYNMLGQSVIRSAPNTNNSTVDMSVLQTGAYFVQVSINKTLKTVRVIKN